ncbi:hypothetical protein predicted by Glimmer/Critica [Sorangium cellulosum So ce56]|uniref:Pesticin C-terminal domain-containing protein n=1 Tax=Sorangium cellulosum (strain So ce56) TaxID=448385 RepID=A9GHP0_SORC5|nr:hypothetical protein predicted by Glimmer/Critica [Sorangium cellulosum So ce56]
MSSSQSGVTIATGFDLGARGLGDLRTLGLPDVLIGKLTPYLGNKTVTAKLYLDRHPFRSRWRRSCAHDAATHFPKSPAPPARNSLTETPRSAALPRRGEVLP